MAISSSNFIPPSLNYPKSPLQKEYSYTVHCRRNLHTWPSARIQKSHRIDLVVKSTDSETAGDVLSSFWQHAFSGFSIPTDNPWLSAFAALIVTVPLFKRLLSLTKQVETAAQTVDRIAETVGKVAGDVDEAREDIAVALQNLVSGLKKIVTMVEDLAEDTANDSQKVEDLIDKVEEMDDKLEEFFDKHSREPGTT